MPPDLAALILIHPLPWSTLLDDSWTIFDRNGDVVCHGLNGVLGESTATVLVNLVNAQGTP